MTQAPAFDTHQFVKTLVEGGFTEGQAEVLAAAQAAVLERNPAPGREIERIRLEAEIQKIETDLLEWVLGALLIVQTAFVVALVLLS